MVGDPGSMQKKRSRTPDVLKVVLRHQLSIADIIIVTVGVINDLSLSITNPIITVTIRALVNVSMDQVKAILCHWPVITIGVILSSSTSPIRHPLSPS